MSFLLRSARWLVLALLAGNASAAATNDDALVVVTATRVPQAAFDLPVSIDRIGTAQLQDSQWRINLSDALAGVAGFNAQNRQNYAQDLQISSRGFGARAAFGVRGVRLVSDGIPASMPDGQGQVSHFDLGSAGRVEVMRGPFSVLYGNAAGGVIALFSEEPAPGMTLAPSFAAGSFGSQRGGVKLSGESAGVSYLIDRVRFTTDGFREHSAAQRDYLNARIGLGGKLTLVANSLDMPLAEDPLGLTRAQLSAEPSQAGTNALTFNTRKTMRQSQLGLNGEWKVGAGGTATLTAWGGQREVMQYQSIPKAVQIAPTHSGGVIDLQRDYSGVDLRWTQRAAMDTPLTATFGVAIERMDENRRGYENFIGSLLGVRGVLRRDEGNVIGSDDLYAQAQWEPSPQWLLLAGLRHSRVRFDSTDHYITALNPDDSGGVRFSATTPALGVTWRLQPELNIYAALGKGFETPTSNELAYRGTNSSGLNLGLQPATSRHQEIGLKVRLSAFGRLNLAAFTVNTDNEIVVAASSGGRTVYANGGRTERHGVEATLRGDYPVSHEASVNTQVAFSVLRAVYADSAGSIVAGNRLPGVPARSLYVAADWRWAPRGLSIGGELRAVDRMFASDSNQDVTSGYAVLNLRLSLMQRSGAWQFKEFVRIDNATNRRYVGSVIANESNGRFYEPAPGRNSLVGVDVRLEL